MLVLSRKRNERVIIGRSVEVCVLEIHGHSVKLGFSGPPDISIHREEVEQRIRQKAAARRVPRPRVVEAVPVS